MSDQPLEDPEMAPALLVVALLNLHFQDADDPPLLDGETFHRAELVEQLAADVQALAGT